MTEYSLQIIASPGGAIKLELRSSPNKNKEYHESLNSNESLPESDSDQTREVDLLTVQFICGIKVEDFRANSTD